MQRFVTYRVHSKFFNLWIVFVCFSLATNFFLRKNKTKQNLKPFSLFGVNIYGNLNNSCKFSPFPTSLLSNLLPSCCSFFPSCCSTHAQHMFDLCLHPFPRKLNISQLAEGANAISLNLSQRRTCYLLTSNFIWCLE